MKKLSYFFAALLVVLSVFQSAFAADTLPSTAVWFTPGNAGAGTPIALNALVYNNQTVTATVTVDFTVGNTSINTGTATITAGSAQTVTANWTMPSTSTVVTATITAAVTKSKKSLPLLLGQIGTVNVMPATAPLLGGISFPGSAQIEAWINPILASIEAYRVKEAAHFTAARDAARTTLGLSAVPSTTIIPTLPETPAPAAPIVANTQTQAAATAALSNPSNYFTVIYTTALASLFSSQTIFYIVLVLLILLVLRFLVKLVF